MSIHFNTIVVFLLEFIEKEQELMVFVQQNDAVDEEPHGWDMFVYHSLVCQFIFSFKSSLELHG